MGITAFAVGVLGVGSLVLAFA